MNDRFLGLVADRVAEVRERIRVAGGEGVRLVAVTKTFGADAIVAAVRAGCDAIGENYAQELLAKMSGLEFEPRPEVHFIGRLQSNKVRQLAPVVDVWQSVDRLALVEEIARRAPGARLLVQVNATGETDKGGCPVADVPSLVDSASAHGLQVLGLMTVGPTDGVPADAAAPFRTLRRLRDDLGLAECSMGMTHDLEVAVAEGATMVRVGTALFGART